jgi:hypothetical protein
VIRAKLLAEFSMPKQTAQSRVDDLVAAFTELGPAWSEIGQAFREHQKQLLDIKPVLTEALRKHAANRAPVNGSCT